jgi:hypothetical protein
MQIFCSIVLEVAQISENVQNRKYKKKSIHKTRQLINKQEAQGPHRSPESYWLIFRI